jgi:hypothetical protein
MDCRGSPLLRSLLGVKQTLLVAAHMSACDPKRTLLLGSYILFTISAHVDPQPKVEHAILVQRLPNPH